MSADIQPELERLSQAELLAEFTRELGLLELVTVYLSDGGKDHTRSHYCALVKSDKIENSMATLTWDLFYGNGIPCAVEYYENGKPRVEYLRFGNDHGVEPLLIGREFHGIRPNYQEISEEFRLFHGLYHDRKEDRYYKINDAGNEELVAIVAPRKIQIRLKEIRQFLAIKEMHLAIFFDSRIYSVHSLENLGLREGGNDQRLGLMRWDLHYGSSLAVSMITICIVASVESD
jgi:ASC-1-like (ASCH) protein